LVDWPPKPDRCETFNVEDLVAIRVTTDGGDIGYFVTWGRIQDAVDPAPLEKLILKVSERFGLPGVALSAQLCDSLQDARGAQYFYEAIFTFAQQPIPYGPKYEKWRKSKSKLMRKGKDLYYAGLALDATPSTSPLPGSIAPGGSRG
jgi:hypothetical protein